MEIAKDLNAGMMVFLAVIFFACCLFTFGKILYDIHKGKLNDK
jgi:hypothetical protein